MADRLRTYAGLASSEAERTLALVAARWITAEPSAARDPLLADLWGRVHLTSSLPSSQALFDIDVQMAGPVGKPSASSLPTNRQPRSILDFFGSSASTSSASTSQQPKKPASPTSSLPSSSPLLIYCDGACAANGRRGAKAGYGVSVWSNGVEIEALSKPLAADEPQTNQRAELRGLQVALEKAMGSVGGAEIHTDSKYALDCLQAWAPRWAANGWRKADGQAVLHQDILKPMWATWKSRGAGVRLFHVSAHTGRSDAHSRGNARADELATGAI